MMRLALFGVGLLGFALCGGSTGCAKAPNVGSSQLPLQRVVIYRNGVGYFERAGNVETDEVRFRMRGEMIGDFLASLAVMEEGGSSVESASFPLDVEEPEVVAPPPSDDPDRPEAERERPAEKDSNRLRDVVLRLDGEGHELTVGYLSETPIWRPSYRLIVEPGGKADLQAWGIVQNLSGEDWNDVQLVLVAGAPLSFQTTLGEPIVPERPIVTDAGEIIAAMPTGSVSLSQAPPAEEPILSEESEADEEGYAYEFNEAPMAGSPSMAPRQRVKKAASKSARRPRAMAPSAPRNLQSLANVTIDQGTTGYRLPTPVTVPDESATMVLYLSHSVPGEAAFLYAPDGGVAGSSGHPFRVARFTNATKGLLEKGPIAVFHRGSFVGQGLVDPLPPGASATVPFALERGVGVSVERKYDQRGARLAKVANGDITIREDRVTLTEYKVQNGLAEPAKVLLRHNRTHNARLVDAPKGTTDEVAQGFALIPVVVPPKETKVQVVDERLPQQVRVNWTSVEAKRAISAFLDDPAARGSAKNPKMIALLQQAWELVPKLRGYDDELTALHNKQRELANAASEARRSLKAIEKNRYASDLRKKLSRQLADVTKAQEKVSKSIIEAGMQRDKLRVEFRELASGITLIVPEPTQPD